MEILVHLLFLFFFLIFIDVNIDLGHDIVPFPLSLRRLCPLLNLFYSILSVRLPLLSLRLLPPPAAAALSPSAALSLSKIRNPSGKTYYQILSVNDDASYDEIRTSYRSSLLIFHPDKIHGKCGIGDDEVHEDFVKIQKAWEVLSDSKLRARYDHELECARHASEIAEDVDLEEMTAENIDERTKFFYPCRCGDCFSVTSEELQEMGLLSDVGKEEGKLLEAIKADKASVLLHCSSCSLKIKLMVRLCP